MPMIVMRCERCGAFLGRCDETVGARVEVKCRYCKTLNLIVIHAPPSSTHGAPPYEKRG